MLTSMYSWLVARMWPLTRKEEGASLVEYALLVALIALACVIAITALGTEIAALFQRIADFLRGVAPAPGG